MIWQSYLSRNSPITRKTSWSLRKRVKEEKAILAKMLQFLSKGALSRVHVHSMWLMGFA